MMKWIGRLTVGAAAVTALIFLFCAEESSLAEKIVTGIGAMYRSSTASFFDKIPFSVASVLFLCLPAVPIVVGVALIFFKPATVLRTAVMTLCGFAVSFFLTFGFGYRREKIASSLPTSSVDTSACASLLSMMTDALAEAPDPGEGKKLIAAVEDKFAVGRVKEIVFASPYRAVGILGFYSPFTAEASIDSSLPFPIAAFTAAHELAHAEGYAREEEADYVAFCRLWESGDPVLRYSAAFAMYPSVASALAQEDPALCASIMKRLNASTSDSLYAAERELRNTEREEILPAADAAADTALKPLGGSTKDYDKAVVLLAARYGVK